MLSSRNKISTKQAMILFITSIYSPFVRLAAGYTAKEAHQAAWLAPLFSVAFVFLLITILSKTYERYKKESYLDITYDIMGMFIGKIIAIVYIVWLTILLALYVRFYAERLVTSIYPRTNISFFIVVMLILVAYVLRSGIVPLARMNEIIFLFITFIFVVLVFLLIPSVDINKLTPISYLDIVPVFKATINITGINIYIFFIFMISDQINNKENIKKIGLQVIVFIFISLTCLIIVTVGTLGSSVVEKLPLSFLSAVKTISVLGFIEKLESILVATWIAADFIIITVFSFVILNLLKSFFNLSDEKPFINIFMIFMYFLSLYICDEVFELQAFSSEFAIYMNVVLGLLVPIFIFMVGKIRKKV